IESRILGADLLGKDVVAPAINRAIPILPGSFIDQGRGTGIVTSVPSDAPDDYVALRDIQQDYALLAKYDRDPELIRAIQPVSICRCITPAIVKVVDNQWFLSYADPAWKAKVHEAIASMDLYPPALRKWFDYVADWLRDWPCAHHRGLGTILPWDSNWVIESL